VRLQWRIYLTFLACTALALALTAGFATRSLHRFYQEQVAADLQRSAGVLASELGPYLAAADRAGVDAHCKAFGGLTSARATVILPDGEVIGDSDADPVRLENHRGRPEIARALQGETGRSTRFSDTLRRTLMYLAIPVRRDGAVVAVARVSTPLAAVDWTLRSVYRQVAWAAVLVAAAFAAVAFGLARRISRPLDDMRRTAERLASGDLQARVALPDGAELQALARALNGMAAQLDQRMALIVRQSEQQKAVFASMVEGVLAVDAGARILDLNASAARLLDADPAQARGRSVLEIVRDPDLQRFVTDTLASSAPTEAQIVLYGSRDRALQLHGTALTDADGGTAGLRGERLARAQDPDHGPARLRGDAGRAGPA
jgi:two-component system phosphate regulon sensor histidine kinase PhoR